jgi:hypothetical protein
MMKRITLACAVAAVSCAILGTELSAQSSQPVTPAPSTSEPVPAPTTPAPSGQPLLQQTYCYVNCDAHAVNCASACIGANPLGPADVVAKCYQSCSTTQLACRQKC